MVFKGTATMIVRISRAIISRPLKPVFSSRAHEIPEIKKNLQINARYPARYDLFPSIYRSIFASYRLSNGHYHQCLSYLMPFRATLNELKRRLFFAGSYFRSSLSFFLFFTCSSYTHIHITILNSSTHSTIMRNSEEEKRRVLCDCHGTSFE